MPAKGWSARESMEEGSSTDSYYYQESDATANPLTETRKSSKKYSTPGKRPSSKSSWGASPTSVLMDDSTLPSPEDEKSLASDYQQQRGSDNDGLLRVQVESSLQRTTFYVPVSLMLQREMEMRESAKATHTTPERWSSSRLHSLWKSSTSRSSTRTKRNNGEEITLRLEPEVTMREYSDLQWQPWLTACIREYYNTGNIRIPDDCLGSDILLALEYFGILTSNPDTFIVESAQALGRIKVWSAYFAHRNALAEWVLSDFRSCLGSSRIWITTSNPDEGDHAETLLQVEGGTAAVLGGENGGRASSIGNENLPPCHVIHFLFFDNESTNQLSRETPTRIRHDFGEHLSRQLNSLDATVCFDVERVKVTKSTGKITTALRAVLRLHISRGGKVDSTRAAKREAMHAISNESDHPRPKNTNNRISEEEDAGRQRVVASDSSGASEYKKANVQSAFGSEDSELARILQGESSDNNRRYSPYGGDDNEDELNNPLSETISASPRVADEQRHPYRSTPPPEGSRIKPEDNTKDSIQTMANSSLANKQILVDQESMQHIDQAAPIGYVNTAFGDLQSVTSALSDPYMDESTVGSLSSRFLVQLARRRMMPDEERRKPVQESPESLAARESYEPVDASEMEFYQPENPNVEDIDERENAKSTELYLEPTQPLEGYQQQDEAEKAFEEKAEIADDSDEKFVLECNLWEGLFGSMCGGTNTLAENNEKGSEYDFFSEVIKTTSRDGQAAKEWLQSTFSMENVPDSIDCATPRGVTSNDARGTEQSAKSIGQSLPGPFDESDATGRNEHTRPRQVGHRDDSLERIAPESRSRSSPNFGREPRRATNTATRDESSASGDAAPPRRTSSPSHREERHRTMTPESDLIALKNRRRSEIHRAKTSALVMHTARSQKISRADLPPREPRRARVREPIARKKPTSSARSLTPSHDFLLGEYAPEAARSTTSKAKVHPYGSSRQFRRNAPSSAIENFAESRPSEGRKMLL